MCIRDSNKALDFYNKALKINSANPDLLYELSDCNFHLGNYDLCENKYKEILKFNPKYIKAVSYTHLTLPTSDLV